MFKKPFSKPIYDPRCLGTDPTWFQCRISVWFLINSDVKLWIRRFCLILVIYRVVYVWTCLCVKNGSLTDFVSLGQSRSASVFHFVTILILKPIKETVFFVRIYSWSIAERYHTAVRHQKHFIRTGQTEREITWVLIFSGVQYSRAYS